MNKIEQSTDVIIIGAGATGLTVASSLQCPYVILEAQSQIGGRLRSKEVTTSEIWDEGAHWIHDFGPHHLFYARFKEKKQQKKQGPYWLFNRDGSKESALPIWEYMEEVYASIATDKPDSSMREYIHFDNIFHRDAITTNTGCHPDKASRIDLAISRETGDNRTLPEGYAQLILSDFQDIPVQLEEIVSSIVWNEQGVLVKSNKEIYRAKAAIITVSVGVLQSSIIEFHPHLPPNKISAINNIQMGLAERVCMVCEKIKSWVDGYFLVEIEDMVVGLECFPYGQNYISAYVAGPESTRGDIESICLRALEKTGYKGKTIKIYKSQWHKNPFVLGAYSAARIHHTNARNVLAQPLPPLFSSGEATTPTAYGTVHGACISGKRVAQEVQQWINSN